MLALQMIIHSAYFTPQDTQEEVIAYYGPNKVANSWWRVSYSQLQDSLRWNRINGIPHTWFETQNLFIGTNVSVYTGWQIFISLAFNTPTTQGKFLYLDIPQTQMCTHTHGKAQQQILEFPKCGWMYFSPFYFSVGMLVINITQLSPSKKALDYFWQAFRKS